MPQQVQEPAALEQEVLRDVALEPVAARHLVRGAHRRQLLRRQLEVVHGREVPAPVEGEWAPEEDVLLAPLGEALQETSAIAELKTNVPLSIEALTALERNRELVEVWGSVDRSFD